MKLRAIVNEPGLVYFHCPGCDENHGLYTDTPSPHNGAKWTWNKSFDAPTFSPSILRTTERFTAKGQEQYNAWYDGGCKETPGLTFDVVKVVCHSFVENGFIRFLSDCTHALANKTVELPELTEDD